MARTKRPKLDNDILNKLTPQILSYIDKIYDEEKIPKFIETVVDTEKKFLSKDPAFVDKPRRRFLAEIETLKTDTERLNLIIRYYIKQIDGRFSPIAFKILSILASFFFSLLLVPVNLFNIIKALFFAPAILNKQILIKGDVEKIRSLEKEGTIIFVPNHTSNYDSIILSNRLEYLSMSPPMWGAGLNLYSNPISRFVMDNVGCYRVDRRNKSVLYLEVLKHYSRYYIEKGFNTIFYPGGTRTRSGSIEQKLKLGLMGTVVDAFVEQGKTNKLFIVPVVITYTYVPEALNLSYDYFYGKPERKRKIKEYRKSLSFIQRLKNTLYALRRTNKIFLQFGDIFLPDGSRYGVRYPEPKKTDIYDREYNRELTSKLGKVIAENYKKYNSVSVMNVFCRAIMDVYKNEHENIKDLDDKNLVKKMYLSRVSYVDVMERIKEILSSLDQDKHLLLSTKNTLTVFKEALDLSKDIIRWNGRKFIILTPELVFYYANKLNFL